MSLLGRRAPHTVNVQNRKMVRNERGAQVFANDGDPIPVRCMGEPVREWSSAEEEVSLGLQVIDMMVIRQRKWPGDVNSWVLIDGNWFETVGVPQHFNTGRRTRHYRVTVKWVKKAG